MAVGTIIAKPLILGTNAVNRMQFEGTTNLPMLDRTTAQAFFQSRA
jgi:hypothetical protein